VLLAFGTVSVWVLALDLYQVVAHARIWTGTDGFYLTDQMQYLAWIRDASHHLLASNLFVLRPTTADYFQPAIAISGLVSALGVAPWLALLLWKPIAVGAAFYAVRTYARLIVAGLLAQRSVLVLGLFFGSYGVIGDLWTGFWSWGYPFGLLSIAAMTGALVAYDRSRAANGRVWVAPLLGAIASALHPWQGETLILLLLAAELIRWLSGERSRGHLRLAGLTVLATGLPLLYYLILGRVDLSWSLGRSASRHDSSIGSILLALAPLLIPAALAYRRGPTSFLSLATRAWPFAALIVYALSATELSGAPLHAFAGISIPLAALSVEGIRSAGWRRVPHRRLLAIAALAALSIPATAYELSIAPQSVSPTSGNASFITGDERHALDYLAADPRSGGVLSRFYLGAIVPAETGRHTFVGHCLWSQPHCVSRAQFAQKLFEGSLTPAVSRSFVVQTGARFVLTDCQSGTDLTATLAPITQSINRFGCATVYVIDTPGPPTGPLAQSGADAALRATWRQ
jgi:hypothetical protein